MKRDRKLHINIQSHEDKSLNQEQQYKLEQCLRLISKHLDELHSEDTTKGDRTND